MDYSASLHDAEHPAGASPWGSPSSPEHNRASFTPAEPQSPYRSFGSSNGLAHEQEEGGFGHGEQDYQRPDTASTVSITDGARSDDARTEVAESLADGSQPAGQEAGATQAVQEESRHSEETLKAATDTRSRKPAQPSFKLQAKITGLERTGRKDPILRFDVYVSN
jgi:hypothetical protein